MTLTTDEELTIYSVSQLNREVRETLEANFPLVWVTGEISNLVQPRSGHMYLTLKDEFAQIRCAMFRGRNMRLNFKPENGMHVIAQAQLSLYEPRGDYQLILQHLEPAGEGLLRQKFEQLKQQLEHEGLFDAKNKQSIPEHPKSIGIITSATGAAIRDIISVSQRRAPQIPLYIYPTQVQGTQAKQEIAQAIKLANQHKQCDILILARGGGSLEDLWPFNEEIVARAIFASTIPIVTGVGHEIDFTIADFVADHRAPTPSAAAELVCPDNNELINTIKHYQQKLQHHITAQLQQLKLHLNHLRQRLQHPGKKLQQYQQNLDYFEQRLQYCINNTIKNKQQALQHQAHNLENLSPLATLNRGYAIVSQSSNNKIIRASNEVKPGDKIKAQLKQGELICEVLEN